MLSSIEHGVFKEKNEFTKKNLPYEHLIEIKSVLSSKHKFVSGSLDGFLIGLKDEYPHL